MPTGDLIRSACLLLGVLAVVIGSTERANAGDATDQLRPVIDEALRLLDDPRLRGPTMTHVEYRMHQVGRRRLGYDVVIEGVSLVANYRSQFNTIIQTSSYAELVRRIKARLAELAAPSPAAMGRRCHFAGAPGSETGGCNAVS